MVTVRWLTRPERDEDIRAIRRLLNSACPSSEEADLVDALRRDPSAWLPGLAMVAEAPDGMVVGYALLTRCHIGGEQAMCLAPVAVDPGVQGCGVGTAVVTAVLGAARSGGETCVIVLGHPDYYHRFGFQTASRFGIQLPMTVPDAASMVMTLSPADVPPAGVVRYATAFGLNPEVQLVVERNQQLGV